MLPSFVVAYSAGKPEALFVGMDAGKAKEVYSANVENPKYDSIQLFVRPEFTRRTRPAKHVARELKSDSPNVDQPKRKASK
jgi:hypothetical protein